MTRSLITELALALGLVVAAPTQAVHPTALCVALAPDLPVDAQALRAELQARLEGASVELHSSANSQTACIAADADAGRHGDTAFERAYRLLATQQGGHVHLRVLDHAGHAVYDRSVICPPPPTAAARCIAVLIEGVVSPLYQPSTPSPTPPAPQARAPTRDKEPATVGSNTSPVPAPSHAWRPSLSLDAGLCAQWPTDTPANTLRGVAMGATVTAHTEVGVRTGMRLYGRPDGELQDRDARAPERSVLQLDALVIASKPLPWSAGYYSVHGAVGPAVQLIAAATSRHAPTGASRWYPALATQVGMAHAISETWSVAIDAGLTALVTYPAYRRRGQAVGSQGPWRAHTALSLRWTPTALAPIATSTRALK